MTTKKTWVDNLLNYTEDKLNLNDSAKLRQSEVQDAMLAGEDFQPLVDGFNELYDVMDGGYYDDNGKLIQKRNAEGKKAQGVVNAVLSNAYERLEDDAKEGLIKYQIRVNKDVGTKGEFYLGEAKKKAEPRLSIPELIQAISDGAHGVSTVNVNTMLETLSARIMDELKPNQQANIWELVTQVILPYTAWNDGAPVLRLGQKVDVKELMKEGLIESVTDVVDVRVDIDAIKARI